MSYIEDWVQSNINRALYDRRNLNAAIALSDFFELPKHPDRPKNWDNFLAVYTAREMTKEGDAVLDAGACPNMSVFLEGLQGRKCYGSNNDPTTPIGEFGHARYVHDDITHSGFETSVFGYIACLSVIEHGVELEAFFRETSRLLRKEGGLFVSFDYWQTPIDTGDRMACGVPVKIFTPSDVDAMIRLARQFDLFLELPFNPECKEPVVSWLGLNYTFANLLFTKA